MPHSDLTVLVPARWPVGGIRSYIRYVYERLGASVGKLILLGPRGNGLDTLATSIGPMEVRAIETEPNLRSFSSEIFRALRREKVHVLHSQGYITGAVATPLARLFRVPHVVTVHDVFHGRTAHGLKSAITRPVLGAILRSADVLQPVGLDVEKNIEKFLPMVRWRGPRIETIRNGIDTDRLAGDEARDLRAELGLSADTRIVGFMGRFMAQKGFRVLIDAVELLAGQQQPQFCVVACGAGGYLQQDQKDIERRGLGSLFRFLPFVTNVGPTLRGMNFLVVPSRWEACPLLPMEALVCGVPVIGTDCIGLREVLANTPAKQVPTENARALSVAIQQELVAPSVAVARQFRSTAAAKFTVEHTASSLRVLLEELACAR
jgi:glycosyltransferase involved in cell wall biosynthesis